MKSFSLSTFIILVLFTCTANHCVGETIPESSNNLFNIQLENLNRIKQDIEIANQQLGKIFLQRREKFQENINKLASIEIKLKSKWYYKGLTEDFHYTVDLWRSFADHSFENISGSSFKRRLPQLPAFGLDDLEDVYTYTQEEIDILRNLENQLQLDMRNALTVFENNQEEDAALYNKVLLLSGKLRSKQHERLTRLGNSEVQSLSSDNFADLIREIRIIPVRWTATFYSKILEFRDNTHAGMTGYLYIAKEILLLSFIIALLIFFIWSFRKLVSFFENITEVFLKKTKLSSTQWFSTYLVTIMNKSIPWLVLMFAGWLFIGVIEISFLKELSNFLPYLNFYIFYRISLIITTTLYFRLKSNGKLILNYNQQIRLIKSIFSGLRLLFISLTILHTINTIVGKALTYSLSYNILTLYAIAFILYQIHKWHAELHSSYHDRKLINLPISNQEIDKLWKIPISFLLLLLISFQKIYHFTLQRLSQYDQIKKFSALVFISKLSKIETNSQQEYFFDLPETYKEAFKVIDAENSLFSGRLEFKTAHNLINEWIQGRGSSHSLVVHGAKGNGKSTLINYLSHKISLVESKRINFKDKIETTSDLLNILKNVLGGNLEDEDSLIEYWKSNITSKVVIYLDDAHNLFLSRLNGFNAIRLLMKIINSDIENIFWCVAFHRYSWSYINNVLQRYQCFDEAIELNPWSAEEIQTFILDSHKKSRLQLSFDDLLMMLGENHIGTARENIENRFFKLLWEQSDGNPARAVNIWIRSLKYDGKDTLRVSKPPLQDMSYLMELNDEIHFICASLTRHEYLSLHQLQMTTNQDNGIISRVLKFGLEKNLISKNTEGYYYLNPDYAGYIIKSLRRKNYVYG